MSYASIAMLQSTHIYIYIYIRIPMASRLNVFLIAKIDFVMCRVPTFQPLQTRVIIKYNKYY